jgi:hypothetical protein
MRASAPRIQAPGPGAEGQHLQKTAGHATFLRK